jgi:hypothetical protein
MKRALLYLSRRLEAQTGSGLTAGQVETFLKQAWARIQVIPGDTLGSERKQIGENLYSLGWIPEVPAETTEDDMVKSTNTENALEWLRGRPDEKVIQRGMVSSGCGLNLDALLNAGLAKQISVNMEDLLRHVEVRREKCLQDFSPSLSDRERWLERLDICILFSRWSRGQHDLRFLNAVFKLNEFWFPALKNSRDAHVFSRFYLSLAEQELSAKELLR